MTSAFAFQPLLLALLLAGIGSANCPMQRFRKQSHSSMIYLPRRFTFCNAPIELKIGGLQVET